MKRILMLAMVLALLGAMVITTASFAAGAGTATQAQAGHGPQYGAGTGAGDCTGPIHTCLDLDGDGVCGKP